MRLVFLMLLIPVATLLPARAEAQSSADSWEFAFGPHLIRRENSSGVHVGGGVTVARRFGRIAALIEAGGTRREGHNDWRAIGGARLTLIDGARSAVFVHALAGTLIRQRSSDWAVLPGLGVDLKWSENRAIRFQFDVPIERSQARTASSIRASVWLVLVSR